MINTTNQPEIKWEELNTPEATAELGLVEFFEIDCDDLEFPNLIKKKTIKKIKKPPVDLLEYLKYGKENCFQNEFYNKTMEIKCRDRSFQKLKKYIKANTTKVKTSDGIFWDIHGGEELWIMIDDMIDREIWRKEMGDMVDRVYGYKKL